MWWTATWVVAVHASLLWVSQRPWWVAIVGISFIRKAVTSWTCMMRGGLKGKHVLITGGSQGLGKAVAARCVREGALVTIVARSESKLSAAVADLGSPNVHSLALDLSKATAAELAGLIETARSVAGRQVDVLVANAGTGHARLLDDARSPDAYVAGLVDLNLKATLLLITAAARAMSGGRICVVSSAAGIISLPGYAYYSATKFGHRGLLAGAYHELKRRSIFLSCFYPGSILTPGYESELEDRPLVTDRIESSCSDTSSADACAAALITGIKSGAREFSNELLPHLAVDCGPSGCLILDLPVALLIAVVRVGWDLYVDVMARTYLPCASSSKLD